jgi:hypothetical protein
MSRAPATVSVIATVLVTFGEACSSAQTQPQQQSPPRDVATASSAQNGSLAEVEFQIGNARFVSGDMITVQSVRGDRPVIEVGGTYQVDGSWTLASQPAAMLALYSTNGEVRGSNNVRVQQGTGTFSFTVHVVREGNLHVSLYPAKGGNSFGGVYFGTGANIYRGSPVPGP